MDPVYNHVFAIDVLYWFISHFSNFGFFDSSGMDCTSNRVDCNVGLCGRFSAIFLRRERYFLRSKCMRLPQNAGDLASLTSEFKTLILCLESSKCISVRRQKNCIVFFLLSNSATKMHSYGKIFPCLTKTSCSLRSGEIFSLYELKFFVNEI